MSGRCGEENERAENPSRLRPTSSAASVRLRSGTKRRREWGKEARKIMADISKLKALLFFLLPSALNALLLLLLLLPLFRKWNPPLPPSSIFACLSGHGGDPTPHPSLLNPPDEERGKNFSPAASSSSLSCMGSFSSPSSTSAATLLPRQLGKEKEDGDPQATPPFTLEERHPF